MNKFKCVILGDSCVGKTSIMNRYFSNTFNRNTETTLGAIFFSEKFISDSFAIDFWDTAGQERYRSLVPMYIRDANIILIVYDVNNKNSFNSVYYWFKLIESLENHYIILIGNKTDLETKVSNEDINSLIYRNNIDFYQIQLSAKENINFDELKKKIKEIGLKLKNLSTIKLNNQYDISISKNNISSNKCC